MSDLKGQFVQCTMDREDIVDTILYLVGQRAENAELWLEENEINIEKKSGHPVFLLIDVCKKLNLDVELRIEF